MACAPFFLLAAIFYSLYYCWPYMAQLPEHINVAIVDEDRSPLSRHIIMDLRATPKLNVIQVLDNRPTAVDAMKAGTVASVIAIPPNFEKDTLNDIPTAITLVANGAFIVKSRTSMAGVSGPLENIAAKAIAAHLAQYGIPMTELLQSSMQPPDLIIQYMYNTLAGYLNFVVPIVFIIIFQTLMLCGAGMLMNEWFSEPATPMPLLLACKHPLYLFSLQLPILLICFLWVLFIEGAAFALHGVNSFQNICATLTGGIFFSFAVSALGILVGLLFKTSKFVIQAVVTSSIPCVFITGNLYPECNIPIYMRVISWFFPSTPGANCMLRASQAGASVNEIFPIIIHLICLWILYSLISVFLGKKLVNCLKI